MSHAALITGEFSRCALKQLIAIANGSLPAGLKSIPNPDTESGPNCVKLVDIYSNHLRSLRSVKNRGRV
jgi:hypothetical protein